jgi:hypothetical protein
MNSEYKTGCLATLYLCLGFVLGFVAPAAILMSVLIPVYLFQLWGVPPIAWIFAHVAIGPDIFVYGWVTGVIGVAVGFKLAVDITWKDRPPHPPGNAS